MMQREGMYKCGQVKRGGDLSKNAKFVCCSVFLEGGLSVCMCVCVYVKMCHYTDATVGVPEIGCSHVCGEKVEPLKRSQERERET